MERTVLVVEDDPFVRGLVSDNLSAAGFTVLQTDSTVTALDLIDDHDPDAIVLDIDLGSGPTGLDLLEVLGERTALFGVLILTNYPAQSLRLPDSAAQVGYLVKRMIGSPDMLIDALERVLTDQRVRPVSVDVPSELANVTPAQMEILRLIALGRSNEAIAEERQVTVRAVETMVSRLFSALGVSNDARSSARVKAAMLYASAMGIPREDP